MAVVQEVGGSLLSGLGRDRFHDGDVRAMIRSPSRRHVDSQVIQTKSETQQYQARCAGVVQTTLTLTKSF